MRHRIVAAGAAVAALTVAGVVVATSATTRALFSDSASGGDSRVGAATVTLGRGGGSVALGYKDLKPGEWQIRQLKILYQGSVPADVTLEIAPSGSPQLCMQGRDGEWKSRPGGGVTVTIDSAASVSYCDLLNGQALPLASAVPPGSERTVGIAVMLSSDAKANLRGLVENDVATVRASGGFTDQAVGTISIATADHEEGSDGNQPRGGKDAEGTAAQESETASAPIPGSSPLSPTFGTPPVRTPVLLPAECEQAGMRLDDFEDVIVLGPGQHTWKALDQRGQGAGPFLVVGTDGDDEIVGSAGADCIVGGGGRDKLAGGTGNDVLIGDTEADQLDGWLGDDWLFGGPGVDDLRGGGGIDRFDGGPDGASCDAGQEATEVVRCQAPAPPTSSPTADDENGQPGVDPTSPTTATPTTTPTAPSAENSPVAENPPAAGNPPSAIAEPASANSAPATTPTAQATPLSDDPAASSASNGAAEQPSAAPASA